MSIHWIRPETLDAAGRVHLAALKAADLEREALQVEAGNAAGQTADAASYAAMGQAAFAEAQTADAAAARALRCAEPSDRDYKKTLKSRRAACSALASAGARLKVLAAHERACRAYEAEVAEQLSAWASDNAAALAWWKRYNDDDGDDRYSRWGNDQ